MGSTPTSPDGQPLGERGIQTRRRILEAVGMAIEQRGLRGLRLADIADEVGFKPPAFYQYFADLDEAILALCEDVGDFLPEFEIDSDEWGAGHPLGTRPFVERFFDYWNQHRGLLTARHVAIMAGDDGSRAQRTTRSAQWPRSLQAKIEAGQREGRIDPVLEPIALGAVLNLMVDVVGMSAPGLNQYWDAHDSTELIEAVSFVFDRVLGVELDRAG